MRGRNRRGPPAYTVMGLFQLYALRVYRSPLAIRSISDFLSASDMFSSRLASSCSPSCLPFILCCFLNLSASISYTSTPPKIPPHPRSVHSQPRHAHSQPHLTDAQPVPISSHPQRPLATTLHPLDTPERAYYTLLMRANRPVRPRSRPRSLTISYRERVSPHPSPNIGVAPSNGVSHFHPNRAQNLPFLEQNLTPGPPN